MNSPTPSLPHINLLQISDTQTGTEGAESGETAVGGERAGGWSITRQIKFGHFQMYWKWANSVPNRICPSQPVRWLKRNERKRNYQGPFNWALKKPFSSDIMWLECFNLSFMRALKLCLFLLLLSLSLYAEWTAAQISVRLTLTFKEKDERFKKINIIIFWGKK